MKATELLGNLEEIINEHGDCNVFLQDPLQPEWRNPAASVSFEPDRESVLVTAED